MSWDTEFIWDSPIRSAKDKQAIHNAIATIKAGGGTDGYPALKESYQVLFERPALLKHVIFLSDGQMTRGDFAGLIRRMAKDKITVSSVAIGKDADAQLMFDIAKWGRGRFYYTEDDSTIPRIFTLETQLASKASLIASAFPSRRSPRASTPNVPTIRRCRCACRGWPSRATRSNARRSTRSHRPGSPHRAPHRCALWCRWSSRAPRWPQPPPASAAASRRSALPPVARSRSHSAR